MGKHSRHLSRSISVIMVCGLGLPALAGCAEDSGAQWGGNDGVLGSALTQAAGGVLPTGAGPSVAAAQPAAVYAGHAAPPVVPPVYPTGPAVWTAPAGTTAAAPAADMPAPPPPTVAAAEPAADTPAPPPPTVAAAVPPPASESGTAAPLQRVADASELPSGNFQQVTAPNWAAGSEWQYSDGYGLKVAQTDGVTTTFVRLDDPQQWFTRRGFLRQEEQSATAHREAVYRTAPPEAGRVLEAGKPLTFRREYMSNGELKVHATSWTVEGSDRITVPAGTFDCALIVMRTRNLVTGWTGFERWWYSPEVQNYVRMEYRYGDSPVASRVLTSYRLANPQAPRVAMVDR